MFGDLFVLSSCFRFICNRMQQGTHPGISPTYSWYDSFVTTEQILALLVAERDKLNRAIEVLQGPMKRRGRPPKNPLAAVLAATTAEPAHARATRKGRHFTAAQRAAAAERMRQRWAAKKKTEPKAQSRGPKKAAKAA